MIPIDYAHSPVINFGPTLVSMDISILTFPRVSESPTNIMNNFMMIDPAIYLCYLLTTLLIILIVAGIINLSIEFSDAKLNRFKSIIKNSIWLIMLNFFKQSQNLKKQIFSSIKLILISCIISNFFFCAYFVNSFSAEMVTAKIEKIYNDLGDLAEDKSINPYYLSNQVMIELLQEKDNGAGRIVFERFMAIPPNKRHFDLQHFEDLTNSAVIDDVRAFKMLKNIMCNLRLLDEQIFWTSKEHVYSALGALNYSPNISLDVKKQLNSM